MTVKFVDATKPEIQAVAADLEQREFAAGHPIPVSVESGTTLQTFKQHLGFTDQPMPLEYMAFVVILLEKAGRTDARAVVHDRLEWFLNAYVGSAEPLAVATFVDENLPAK
jgi:hypothetical protein